ncbi:LGFP repeat-containing protein [Gordonia sp. CPCC 205333]|uniref:LGFP repeat-containing protein n=1 Tax=Gordonia sp. CPCC 205333 TaxID=3140790 RepID=UPI003AF38A61
MKKSSSNPIVATLLAISFAVTAWLGAGSAHADRLYGNIWVVGKIEQAYVATGGPQKWGNPTISESAAANGGRFQRFAKDTSFYWHPSVASGVAHQVGGAIRAKWADLQWERGPLGYPVKNEQGHPESTTQPNARSNDFQGGAIFWSAQTGAHPIWGEIYTKWLRLGATRSQYGLPITDEYKIGNRFAQRFEHGLLAWP